MKFPSPATFITFILLFAATTGHTQYYYDVAGLPILPLHQSNLPPFRVQGQPRLLLTEHENGFYACIQENHGDTLTSWCPLPQSSQLVFLPDEKNELRLDQLQVRSQKSGEDIRFLYDMDRDGNHDLVVQQEDGLYLRTAKGAGMYTAPKKLISLPGKNQYADIRSPWPGVWIIQWTEGKKHRSQLWDVQTGTPVLLSDVYLSADNELIGYWPGKNSARTLWHSHNHEIILSKTKTQPEYRWSLTRGAELAVADFNADGWADLLTAASDTNGKPEIFIYFGNPQQELRRSDELMLVDDPAFADQYTAWGNSQPGRTREDILQTSLDWISDGSLHILELNNDAAPDFIYQGEYLVAFFNRGDGHFSRSFMGGPYDPDQVYSIDVNADRLPDILVNAFNQLVLQVNHGDHFEAVQLLPEGYSSSIMAYDADADGDPDLRVTGFNHHTWLLENTGGKFLPARYQKD